MSLALRKQQAEVLAHGLHIRLLTKRWLGNDVFTKEGGLQDISIRNSKEREQESTLYGTLLRANDDDYAYEPSHLSPTVVDAVRKLNLGIAFTMCTHLTSALFDVTGDHETELFFPCTGRHYQIVDSLEDILESEEGEIKKLQYACFIRRERMILIWGEDEPSIMARGEDLLTTMLSHFWGADTSNITRHGGESGSHGSLMITPGMTPNMTRPGTPSHGSAPFSGYASPAMTSMHDLGQGFGKTEKMTMTFNEVASVNEDAESMKPTKESLDRDVNLLSSFSTGFAVFLLTVLLGCFGIGELVKECLYDGQWARMALAAILPLIALSGLFFFLVIFGDIFQIIGPISNCIGNSRYYSGVAPNIRKAYEQGFEPPHITIQMPVYKEGLAAVIKPTVESLKEAISHYELNGGSANIFVNDDGMQLIPEEDALARRKFYHNNNIGWVARPGHNVDGFVRAGKFKKASNMNFALNIANKTEDALNAKWEFDSGRRYDEVYAEALNEVLEENGRAWAAGNIRIGEHILIVDSDTRVPHDCLINGAAELYMNPEVAIIQHSCSVMQVVGDYFENAITWFTNQIYTAIRVSIASGEVAPFVGHNAFLRWKAVQSVAVKGEDGQDKFWSESHVSEDFDIAIRLQVAGNVVRYAAYHNGGFKEGVSLTVYDELARWEKYAYGCNELVFNPFITWLWKGPITPLFRKFLWSKMQLSSKITISAYIITYYAIAAAFPLTVFNYLYIGWMNTDGIDNFYLKNESWRVLISVTIVFSGLGNISLPILHYRLGEKPFFRCWIENLLWLPIFVVFFSGVSFHISCAILAQMFGVNMQWGATAKELEKSNFFIEVPKIFKRFKWMYAIMVPIMGGMIYLGCFAPQGYRIVGITATLPLAITLGSHMLLPFILNPALMIFQF